MFTLQQIKAAHAKVKSGADFPAYIRDLKILGVTSYETFVFDGHTKFDGHNDQSLISESKYPPLNIKQTPNLEQFRSDLANHQQGYSDYPAFCRQSAAAGIEKWAICMEEMTCTYFDKAGNKILVEQIPTISGE